MGDSFTLDELLEQEEIILFDSSVVNLQAFSSEYFGGSPGFNGDFLQEDCSMTQAVIDFIEKGKGKVYTTGNVADELSGTKAKVLRAVNEINFLKDRARKKHAKYRAVSRTIEEELNLLLFNVGKLMRLSKRQDVVYTPSDKPCYNDIFNLIRLFGGYFKELHIKQGKKNMQDNRTDEGVIATAYYMALLEGKSPAVLTEDSGFYNVLAIGHSLMTSLDVGYTDAIKEMFKPIRLFLRNTRTTTALRHQLRI